MPITTDFLLLYAELKVNPDCSLDHFKRAYRRRVAELHPDRAQGQADPAAMARLQNLTRLHDEAIRFHDRHGRLPGSNKAAQTGPTDAPPSRTALTQAMPARSATRSILIVVLLLAALAVLWFFLPDETADDSTQPDQVSAASSAPAGSTAPVLTLGMDEGDVRRIQGEPAFLTTDVWEYGPSYVRFEKRKVVGWYSSPLYPLKTGTPSRTTSNTH
jgi:DnaJ domain